MQDTGYLGLVPQRDGMGREVGGGSGLGTHVHPRLIHVNVWQNQYSIVKQKKKKNLRVSNGPYAFVNFTSRSWTRFLQ